MKNVPLAASRIPIAAAAFICPGAGQLLQRRWWAGAILGLSFLGLFVWTLSLALRVIIDYYRLAFDDNLTPKAPDITAFMLPFILALCIYLISLIDVFLAYQRITTQKRLEGFLKDHAPTPPENAD